ncbi:hypothetical protein HMPREF1049_1628 [Fusobacterium necrophorum subsp. funduliforme ATCC 51357]|nr:hypothetical protein HMPREF1049_1628 [Fusobacterium necrophorum subsp. funduliforme ATCC 51357]
MIKNKRDNRKSPGERFTGAFFILFMIYYNWKHSQEIIERILHFVEKLF